MPSEFLTTYRQRFRAFHSERNREGFLFHSGQKTNSETAFIHSEFSDLFSRSTIENLQHELSGAPPYLEIELEGLRELILQAHKENLRHQVRELTAEIQDYENNAQITWEGEALSFSEAQKKVLHTAEVSKRRQISARLSDAQKGAQNLRAERWTQLHAAARDFGAQNYLSFWQNLRQVDYEKFAAQMQSFLSETESKYLGQFASVLTREAHVFLADATSADLPLVGRLQRFDEQFHAWRIVPIYRETFSGLGISTYGQTSLKIDDQPRANKKSPSAHFPVEVPNEIKIVFTPGDGYQKYQALLHEAGHAQPFAWTSRTLLPEFQFVGDYVVREAFALLFGSLLQEERWLAEMLHMYESKSFRHTLAVLELMRLRKYAAQLNYEVEFHAEKLPTNASARYVELLTEAVRAQFDDADHLRSISEDFYPATFLRASAFASQLREQLKTKFGSRWWASRRAGEYLIDLWNTGGRYKADELAKLIDLGELAFDWLSAECLAKIQV